MAEKIDVENMKRLFPGITDEEAYEAAENFRGFAAVLMRIWSREDSDSGRTEESEHRLTASNAEGTLSNYSRSKPHKPNPRNNSWSDASHTSESRP
jgi:hypothetical protein